MFRLSLGLIVLLGLVGCGDSQSKGPSGVILLRYNPGSESTNKREEGFLAELNENHPEIHILSSNQYSGTSVSTSVSKAEQMLIKYRGRVDGMFAVCEPNANGTLRALEDAGLARKVKFIGFDPNDRMVEAMRDGKIHGIVLQDPVSMGYLAVKTMVAHLEGEKVEKRISTGEFVATPENMDTEEMKRLLHPPQYNDTAVELENPKYHIAVIPKGTTHEFWKSVHFGAQKAANELGNVKIYWQGPANEKDVVRQISIVEAFINKKIDGICLAPNNSQSLVGAVKTAKQAGIDTVVFDSGLDYDGIVSYVATDNFQGGRLAARRLAEVLSEKKTASSQSGQ